MLEGRFLSLNIKLYIICFYRIMNHLNEYGIKKMKQNKDWLEEKTVSLPPFSQNSGGRQGRPCGCPRPRRDPSAPYAVHAPSSLAVTVLHTSEPSANSDHPEHVWLWSVPAKSRPRGARLGCICKIISPVPSTKKKGKRKTESGFFRQHDGTWHSRTWRGNTVHGCSGAARC